MRRWPSRFLALVAGVLLLAGCSGGPGDAVQLVFTSIPATVILEEPFSVTVQARDSAGRGTGTIQFPGEQRQVEIQLSLGGAPRAAALGAADRVADCDGNAIFQDLSLDIPGLYSLVASVPTVPAMPLATSPTFTVLLPDGGS
jgi:hypothetical protein